MKCQHFWRRQEKPAAPPPPPASEGVLVAQTLMQSFLVRHQMDMDRMPTLRDMFAMAALAGISGHVSGPRLKTGETHAQAHARWSFEVADRAMQERRK